MGGWRCNIYLDRKVIDDQKSWNVDGRIIAEVGSATART